jgi:hypothetical protein
LSDEELNDTLDNSDGDETTSQDVSENTPSDKAYCTIEEVNSLFGDISDDISQELFTTVIKNSTAWIDSNLQKAYVPVPSVTPDELITSLEETNTTSGGVSTSHTHVEYNLINVPDGLRTAAIYYAASDIILSLYHGDELPIQYDVWFNKAQSLLDDYIAGYLNSDEVDDESSDAHRRVKHSHGRTYNEKRGRGRRWRI